MAKRKSAISSKSSKTQANVLYQDETIVHPFLKEYFGYCLFKASAWHRALMNKALKKYDLQNYHLGIMKVLEITGQSSQMQLGEELGIDKASMVKLIDHLESKKYLVRLPHPTDRRVKNIKLTSSGLKMCALCTELKEETEAEFFKDIKPQEAELLKQLIPRLLPRN